ncbi:isoprenoid synthase domain-containing protein [Scleroderma yunnanense]
MSSVTTVAAEHGAPSHDATHSTVCVQLPDILSICSPFELRTNRHCKAVSQASEKWLTDSGSRALASMNWRSLKVGLLAAACYPTADVPQLKLITDVLSLLIYQIDHTNQDIPTQDSGVTDAASSDSERDIFSLLSDRLTRVAYRHPAWYMRFCKSQLAFCEARCEVSMPGVTDLENYMAFRRKESGFLMTICMIEYARDLKIPESILESESLQKLQNHACDIAILSEDIVSCAKGTSVEHPNVVTVLRSTETLSLEGALAVAETTTRKKVDAFVDVERTVLENLATASQPISMDVRSYIQGLRDWVSGFVNWLYETHRYLGEKGSKVRAFGWVFIPVNS